MTDELRDKVRQIMADIFQMNAAAIPDNAEMGLLSQWDSGNHVNLVLAIEQEFGVSFDVPEIERMTSFQAVLSLIGNKL